MNAEKILRTVPREKAFYFFTSIGNYTGISASSIEEFLKKINEVNIKSLEFHFHRGDFEKWMAEVLEDKELAEEVRKLQRFNLSGDTLRNRLYEVVSKRVKHLTSQLGLTESEPYAL
ncbi:MAG: DUF5752 family protein [Candidatus Bathyarchaeia archaeon]